MEAAHLSGKPGADLGLPETGTWRPAQPRRGGGAPLAEGEDPRHRDARVRKPPAFAAVHLTAGQHHQKLGQTARASETLLAKGCQRPAGNVGELKPKYSFCQCVCNYGTIYFILSKCVSFPSACFLGPCRGIAVVCVHNQSTEITSNKGPLETWVWGWLTFCEPRCGWFFLC